MTELKTLKDLRYKTAESLSPETFIENSCSYQDFVLKEDLRQEAIKWVKEMNESEKDKLHFASPQTYFKVFFNLTEEDLNGRS
jgi:hypothetical protein